jgi:hypothetical protein
MVSGLGLLLLVPEASFGQLTVQQPVFGVNSVTTTVSVPDRGRAHLGSISRARDSRTHFGPFRPGTSTGLDREHSTMSVGVTIHDFAAMDEYLLSQGSASAHPSPQLAGNALRAYEQLQAHHGGASARAVADPLAASKSEKYFLLGQKAEREGKPQVARLHYRVASRQGSKAAQDRLDELDAAPTSTQVAGAGR